MGTLIFPVTFLAGFILLGAGLLKHNRKLEIAAFILFALFILEMAAVLWGLSRMDG